MLGGEITNVRCLTPRGSQASVLLCFCLGSKQISEFCKTSEGEPYSEKIEPRLIYLPVVRLGTHSFLRAEPLLCT